MKSHITQFSCPSYPERVGVAQLVQELVYGLDDRG